MMLRETILVFAVLIALATATQVNVCGSGEKFADSNQVQITGCDTPPCKLKRRSKASVEQKFTPDQDVQTLTNSVHAAVLSVPLPFIGVDGTSACENIFNVDGTPAGCSLQKGVEYIYKREFPILQIYPTISMVIHYALVDGSHTVACFEVPAKITN
ncbi:PREDICTED: ecdysteroid-regulated 16 kDa protein [Dufourea novaeangliae]|uniref:ecdysteroid-regulated 16 kDa protein n=1 Tax=Dufourea novaeangliae TaxID=178035 RepID=UPI00076747D5|nr:PREDICTED: ecdysteroid-regulated 16 kDa protein [Dufourea novaeangliae]